MIQTSSPQPSATALPRKHRIAARKVRDLEAAEQRLRHAEQWSLRRGDIQRAAAYNRQAEAALEERRQWLDILKPRPAPTSQVTQTQSPSPPDSDTVHLLSLLIVVASLCVNVTVSVHKLPQSIFMTVALLVTMYIFASSSTAPPPPQTDVPRQTATPEPWSKVVARRELASKASAKSQVLLPMVSRAKLCHTMRTKL